MIATSPLPVRSRTLRTEADAQRAVYADLRMIARRLRSRESPGMTLATTGLVHEAYLALQRGSAREASDIARGAGVPLGLYARAMRNVLVSAARKRGADKRGGGVRALQLHDHDVRAGADPTGVEGWAHLAVDLDRAMDRLQRAGERLHRVVELKFFAGLEITEIAAVTGTSPATVKRDWEKARALLYAYVAEGEPSEPVQPESVRSQAP
ncbi:ECF-type sigma factor [Rubrivirga sp. SAORIC476]|uniref:ECF-type sigma factor n=1 Tax=Rubrivirga sp. SAORIC476 TaxID=1961794 RepID=UPI000BA8FAB1|nr:ECF-type sigma factor [Rubrivirga sp. SAORIC476]